MTKFEMGKLKSILVGGILIMSLIVGGCSKENTKDKIILGTSADYPPYEFHIVDGEDKIVGFDIDIANEIAKDLGKELEIKDMNFGGLIAALKSDSVDFVIAGMNADEERAKEVDFSNIYYSAAQGIIVANDATEIINMEDLKGLTVGVQKGTVQEKIVQDLVVKEKIVGLNKIGDLIMQLKNKKIDAILVELPVAKAYSSKNTDLKVINPEYISDTKGFAVAIKKGNKELVDQINQTLNRLEKEGKLEEYLISNIEKANIEE